jgi:tetratricopeptide (TPR) repeat protein
MKINFYITSEKGNSPMLSEQIQNSLHKLERGQVEEGLQEIKKLIDHPDMHDELCFELALSIYQYGFVQEAVDILEPLHLLYPDEPEITLALAEMYAELDRAEEATGLLHDIPQDHDDYVRAVLLSAEVYMMEGLHEVAEHKLLKALETNPRHQVLHQALAEVHYEQEDYAAALIHYQKGIEPPLDKVAHCFAQTGQFETALEYYESALQKEKTPDALFGYGFVSFQLGKWEQSVKTLASLLESDPYYTSAYPYLAEAQQKTGDVDGALQTVEKGLKYDETNPRLNDLYARLLLQTGDTEQAKLQVDRTLAQDPHYVPALEKAVELARQEGDYRQALEHVKTLIDSVPGNADYYMTAGELYEETDRFDRAEQNYRQALEVQADNVRAMNRLAFLLRDEGRPDEAIELWQQSLRLQPEQWDIEELLQRHEEERH